MRRRLLVPVLLAISSPAWASWPEDIDLYSMLDQDGEPVVDRELLGNSYRQLVMELGTMVSNKPVTPAETLGLDGFDVDISNQFILTEATDRKGEPSPWTRAHADENSAPYHMIPTFSVRKGLPLSTEIGGSMGWIGGSSTGVVGGFARVAVFEGYRPLPDISLKLGYSGYVGNDQLDCGALDLSATIGTTAPVGRLPGVNSGQISPWFTFTTLRVSANATIDQDVETDIGALRYAKNTKDEQGAAAIAIPEFGGGVQFVSNGAHLRLAASWAPATIPVIVSGFGFTF
ncbi:MAG: hypothetical protein KC621_02220 [Myxococcales bacterium]|nr:hypothetical protein [Myxococcales bacterium]